MKQFIKIGTLTLISTLTACGGGGSSSAIPAPSPTPVVGCYGTNPDGSKVFLGIYQCSYELILEPTASKYAPLTNVGNPPAGPNQ